MATKDEMLAAQHKAIQKLHKEKREQSNEFEIMRMQNYEYRTMIMQLLEAFGTIEESEDLPAYEFRQFVRSKVADTLGQFGRASTFAGQTDPQPLEVVDDRYDD